MHRQRNILQTTRCACGVHGIGTTLGHIYTRSGLVPHDGDTQHPINDLETVEWVPKALADELAEMLTVYDEADYLPHGRVTNALTAYREAVGG